MISLTFLPPPRQHHRDFLPWEERHGGRLHLLDERAREWRTVDPVAGTLVLFRADRVLHKVEPCRGGVPRDALTVFLSNARSQTDVERARERERAALLSIMASYA